ncbi:MAG: hypothetical protein MH472_04200 [Bacteroidia bacterium]|nr:hypothetical protein [Bacteroidia bacterium]
MLRLIYSLILFFASFNLWAQVSISKLSDRHYLDYKIQTTILVSSEVLKENVKHQILPDALCNSKKPSNVTTVSAEQLSLDLTKDVLYLVNDTLYVIRDVIQNFRLRSYLDSVQPVKINFLNDFKYTSRKIARLHGVAAVTVWFLSEFVQIVSIPITAALGIPEVGVLIVASPLNFINMAITIKAINVSHQLSLKKAYGGFVKKRQAIKNRKKIERKYVSKNENTILHQLATSQDTAFYVSLNRNNLFTEIFSLFRLNQNKVYFRNIKRFVKKNNVCDTVLNILQNKYISKQMRSVYAIDYLHKIIKLVFKNW